MDNNNALKEYANQLKSFKKYMDINFNVLMENGNSTSVDLFYNSDFEIKWRGKTVTLSNGADVFQGIEELIDQELYEIEEILEGGEKKV